MSHGVCIPIGLYVAVIVALWSPLHILSVVGAPLWGMIYVEVVGIAVCDGRLLLYVQTRKSVGCTLGYMGVLWCKPMHTQLFFEEGKDTIHGASLCTAVDEQMLANGKIDMKKYN